MLHSIPLRQKLIVMIAVMSSLFLVALDQTIVSPALGAIVQEFHSFSSLGFVVTAYMITSTVTVPLAGKLGDMFGRRPLILSGVAIFTIGSLLSGMSSSIENLILWRAIQGIGGGVIMANTFTIIGDLFTPKERGRWQGITGAVFGMSSVIGPLLGGWLTDRHQFLMMTTNWRWAFLINVPIGIVATIMLLKYCPSIRHGGAHHPDYMGALFITIALSTLVMALDNTEMIFEGLINNGVSLATIQTTLLAISAFSTVIFLYIQRRARQPVLPLHFFHNKTYRLIAVASLLYGVGFLGLILYLTQFNQQVFHASASEAGLMLLPMTAGIMISSITVGRMTAKTGHYKKHLVAGFLLASVATLLFTTLQPDTPYTYEAIMMFIVGLGFGMAMPILSLVVQNELTQKDLGAATASIQLFRGLGSTVGAAMFAGILTTGVMANIQAPDQIPYIQTLRKVPQASTMMKELDADTLLRLNAQKATIRESYEKQMRTVAKQRSLPPKMVQKSIDDFTAQQDEFEAMLQRAFTDSLHEIFLISSGLMFVSFVLVSFIKEKRLR